VNGYSFLHLKKHFYSEAKQKKQQAKAGTKAYCISLFYAQKELYNVNECESNFHALPI
jgi:hypothetical protein